MPPSAAAAIRSLASITRRREWRSASRATNGASTAGGTRRITVTRPTAGTPPAPYAKTASATVYAQVPVVEPISASCRRRIDRLRNAARRPERASRIRVPCAGWCILHRVWEDTGGCGRLGRGKAPTRRRGVFPRGKKSEDRGGVGTRHRNDDEADVEGHRMKIKAQDEPKDETENDDEPDVEAHRMKNR